VRRGGAWPAYGAADVGASHRARAQCIRVEVVEEKTEDRRGVSLPHTRTQRVAPNYGRQGPLTLRHRPQEVDQQTRCTRVEVEKRTWINEHTRKHKSCFQRRDRVSHDYSKNRY
jgi:hypothetical protein